jgi:soluble lytic murein transglycosylase-like protein
MDGASAAPLKATAPHVASYAQEGLRRGLVGPDGRPDQAAVKNAFESLLLAELLKPFQESLSESELFPSGAQGDIYASFWQSQLSELLAAQLDLLPGWSPDNAVNAVAAGGPPSGPVDAGVGGSVRGGGALPFPRTSNSPLPLNGAAAALGMPGEAAVGLAARVAAAAAARARVATPARTQATGSEPAASASSPPTHLSRPSGAQDSPGQTLASQLAPFEPAIQDAARATGLEANWLRAVIMQESAGQPDAVSHKGAAGLMQLLPATAAALGVRNLLEPAENVMAGARYLRSLFERYGDPKLALAAYNAGPGRVEAYGGIPPFRETRNYVDRVLALKGAFDRLSSGTPASD